MWSAVISLACCLRGRVREINEVKYGEGANGPKVREEGLDV